MAWEIVAVWAIVVPVVIWFWNDEKAIRHRLLNARAQRFATHPFRRSDVSHEDETLASTRAERAAAPVIGDLEEHERAFVRAIERTD